jgi:hypothetical protein
LRQAEQVEVTRAVVRWYLKLYHRTTDDLGTPTTFVDRSRVGSFAISPRAFERGEPAALFRMLIAMTLFQRRQDQQVMRILQRLGRAEVRELSDVPTLRRARASASCPNVRTLNALLFRCDLTKDSNGRGTCGYAPRRACYLKRHTELLKRYGHFGKVPTSVVMALDAGGAANVAALRRAVVAASSDPKQRALGLEAALMNAWRINRKIAAMFLSGMTNPDLSAIPGPWSEGVDWTEYIVIDSNTDQYLATIGYRGSGTYDARHQFITRIAHDIDLSSERPGLHAFNPRVVQQAMYMFMSRSNRRSASGDCWHAARCRLCLTALRERCPVLIA